MSCGSQEKYVLRLLSKSAPETWSQVYSARIEEDYSQIRKSGVHPAASQEIEKKKASRFISSAEKVGMPLMKKKLEIPKRQDKRWR